MMLVTITLNRDEISEAVATYLSNKLGLSIQPDQVIATDCERSEETDEILESLTVTVDNLADN